MLRNCGYFWLIFIEKGLHNHVQNLISSENLAATCDDATGTP